MLSKRAPQTPSSDAISYEDNQSSSPDTPDSKDSSAIPGIKGFFPATARDVQRVGETDVNKPDTEKRTARGERYVTKTSSTARKTEAFISTGSSSEKNLMAPKKTRPHDIDARSASDLKEDENDFLPSPRSEAKVMLVAAMAAAAAQNRSSAEDASTSAPKERTPVKEFDSRIDGGPMNVGVTATAATTEKVTAGDSEVDQEVNVTSKEGNTRKKTLEKKSDDTKPEEEPLSLEDNMTISAFAAASVLSPRIDKKERKKSRTKQSDGAPMGIAAMAAAAARKKTAESCGNGDAH